MGAFSIIMRSRRGVDDAPCITNTYPVTGISTADDAVAQLRKFLPADRFEVVSVLPLADAWGEDDSNAESRKDRGAKSPSSLRSPRSKLRAFCVEDARA